ncbi:MAG: glycosyltransferase family 2 protein [Arachidicoccus sp.]|nr:glycosyltransferase family 2 protein [Arachidicoccus sp.]
MLSIIYINYFSVEFLLQSIDSLYQYKLTIPHEIIIVNNSSEDKDLYKIIEKYPSVIVIEIGYNAGFARANNLGIQHAKGEVVLLLNPDTLIIDHAIENVYRSFTQSNYVACGVQLLNEDGTPQISGNYAMKGGLNYLLPLPYVGNFIKWIGNAAKVKKPNVPNASTTVEVDWINGAFLMVKKNAIEKAGLLDEDFFLYAEEAEWCNRLKKFGNLCIYGDNKIIHFQGESANDAFNSEGKGYYNLYDRKGLQIMLSNFVRIRKEFGKFWFLFDLCIYTFEIPVFFVAGFLHHLFASLTPFKHFEKATKFSKNVFYIWRLAPTIIKNKPHFYKAL